MQAKTILTGAAVASALLIGSAAWAQQTGGSPGSTTGPAAGSNVQPSTATQKENDSSGRSATTAPNAAGGGAGVEGKPGNKSGRSEKPK
jgi:archaellin